MAGGFLEFPFILITIYFFISIFTLYFPATEFGKKEEEHKSFVPTYVYTMVLAYLISPIWTLIHYSKNN